MEIVRIPHDYDHEISIENKSIDCPFCKRAIVPQYIYASTGPDDYIEVFTRCTSSDCKRTFITCFYRIVPNTSYYSYIGTLTTESPTEKEFSPLIKELSPNFVDIYNQAYAAEQSKLDQISGVGYRKALEFIIKDYLISLKPESEHEKIKNKFLINCIRDDVEDRKIKLVATRAVWLGNDETHYMRKWENKDVQDLKAIIDLTIHWIESEIGTNKLLEDMPEYK